MVINAKENTKENVGENTKENVGENTKESGNAIELLDVVKQYDGFCLDHVSFTVPRGCICGFIGQNGAGKTTTIKAVLNVITMDAGTIRVCGCDNRKQEREFKEKIAVVFDETPFHDDLNAKKLNAILKGVFRNWEEETYFHYLEEFGIPIKRKIGAFSKGMKMKLQIAVALSHNAELLIIDEATAGLDPIVRNEVLDIFMKYMQDENHTILMSSHITSDLEKLADTIVFIHKGKILLQGFKDDILENYGVMKCRKEDFHTVDSTDYISVRQGEFAVEMLVSDRRDVKKRYPMFMVEKTNLEEIMLYYVQKESAKSTHSYIRRES